MPPKIDVNVNNIIFESYTVDPTTGHPIYAFDSTYLPSSAEVNDGPLYELLLDKLMDKLISRLPSQPFSLVVFSSGFTSNNISWVDGIRMYSRLPKPSKSYLQKMYIVHESFFIRTVYQVLKNVMNIKFLNGGDSKETLIHVSNLSELAEYIDITKLRISLNVYLYDYEISDTIRTVDTFHSPRVNSISRREYRQLIFDKIFKRLRLEAPINPLVFQKPGSYKKINILLDVIDRTNYIDLSQWDIYSIASVFLHFMKGKSKPLFPIDLLPLPIDDSFEYTYNTFFAMMAYNGYYDLVVAIFPFFLTLIENSKITNHTYMTLSKCLTSSMCKEKVSIKSGDRLAIGTRFIRNLLIHFEAVRSKMEKHTGLHRRSKSVSAKVVPQHMLPPKYQDINHRRSKTSGEAQLMIDIQNHSRSPSPPPLPKRLPVDSLAAGGIPSPTSICNARLNSKGLPARGSPRKTFQTAASLPVSAAAGELPSIKNKTSSTSLRLSTLPTANDTESDSDSLTGKSKPETATTVIPLELIPSMKLRNNSSNISLRLSSAALWKDSDSTDANCSTHSSRNDAKKPQTQDKILETDSVIMDEHSSNVDPIVLVDDIKHLAFEKNEKIQTFDQELKKKKLKSRKSTATIKFSPNGYSDIPSGNKVSRLATLYEQRLQGLKIIQEVKKE